jgi:hypothetical protein
MTSTISFVKEIDLESLYTSTIHAIFVIDLFFYPEVNRNNFLAKYFYPSTILDYLSFPKRFEFFLLFF